MADVTVDLGLFFPASGCGPEDARQGCCAVTGGGLGPAILLGEVVLIEVFFSFDRRSSSPTASDGLFGEEDEGLAGNIGATPAISGRTILSLLPIALA